MYKVRLLISYDGTDFAGWQRQKNVESIQETLENLLSRLFDQRIQIIGAGRTDAGVHAYGQVAHFVCAKDPRTFPLVRALQRMAPRCLVVKKAWLVPENFHALASACEKTYRYYILNRETPSPFRHPYTWWISHKKLSLDWLNAASKNLIGEMDFKSFQSSGTPVKTTVRKIFQAEWRRQKNDLVVFTVRGNGFLKQMVRNIVGTLIDLERQDTETTEISQILDKRDRRFARTTAPAEGLFLLKVKYPDDIEATCEEIIYRRP